jgi:hypothetical protein
MKKRLLTLAAALAFTGRMAQAEDLNLNLKADTTVESLSPYSIGVGVGVLTAASSELHDQSPAFLKTSLIQTVAFGSRFEAGLDLDWLFPGYNWGAEVTATSFFATGQFKPFVGAGAGLRYFDTDNSEFMDNLGPSVMLDAGVVLDVLDELQVRVRVPFTMVFNDRQDRTVGVDVGLLFSSPHRKTKVKKLTY